VADAVIEDVTLANILLNCSRQTQAAAGQMQDRKVHF
jgi:hypothetical protein